MTALEVDKLVQQLSAGFEALQDEYQKLHGQHQLLERKLAAAREQYNELAKTCESLQSSTTPPLSLSSIPSPQKGEPTSSFTASEILDKSNELLSREAARLVRAGATAAQALRDGLPPAHNNISHGVRIWSGPSADKIEPAASVMMPSISESPLEQDFTVEGKPSKLGCPFSGMANKKLSSHAASVLSRYNQSGSVCAVSTQASSASRVNGRESMSRRYSSRRESFVDPIKADICGMTHHSKEAEHDEREGDTMAVVNEELPPLTKKSSDQNQAAVDAADVGVCPIRFLDQHSPEEVATYFENHKHELPRSHEVCVMRYQSNEEQIRELDAKYGNLVSMIQGLGKKHQDLLPEEPQDAEEEEEYAAAAASNDKVRKWARSVSAQAVDGNLEDDEEERGSVAVVEDEEDDVDGDGGRKPHFARPLRDIRVGESPSRPWGIQVPAKYLERAESATSSKPVEVSPPPRSAAPHAQAVPDSPFKHAKSGGKCPFGHGAAKADSGDVKKAEVSRPAERPVVDDKPDMKAQEKPAPDVEQKETPQMLITGPVFIGYSADDAIRILRESGLQMGRG